jgi:hypothetical protein
LVDRFQFHRRDGGGVPMCYVITAAGIELLQAGSHLTVSEQQEAVAARASSTGSSARSKGLLPQASHDVHVAAWALALGRALSDAWPPLRGPAESVLSPPTRSTPEGRVGLGPGDLRLPGGRAAHDFLRATATGESVEVERFETVRPDAIVEVRASAGAGAPAGADGGGAPRTPAIDLIIELDDRVPVGRAASKLERYDHFLAGWSAHLSRYGRRREAVAVVVMVCRDRARARECARRADSVLRACRAYAGEYPFDWEYPGREGILFASERDMHEGLLRAYGVPRLPPQVRVSAAHGDPRAGEATAEPREIPVQRPATSGP